MTNLVGKYFLELQDEHMVVVGKVVEQVEPIFYLITYNYKNPDPALHLKTTHDMTGDNFRFFASLEGARAEIRRLSEEEPDKVVTLVKP